MQESTAEALAVLETAVGDRGRLIKVVLADRCLNNHGKDCKNPGCREAIMLGPVSWVDPYEGVTPTD